MFFFFNDTATTEIYTLSLHDALPIFPAGQPGHRASVAGPTRCQRPGPVSLLPSPGPSRVSSSSILPLLVALSSRSEEHTSELQSRQYLVCRLLLEKKKNS